MKNRIIWVVITLLVITIGFSVYLTYRPPPLLSVQEQIPVPEPHEHTAPDGSTVEHIHTYDFAKPDTNTDKVESPQASDTKHPILRAWERLDLEEIRRKYQPYTVAEMHEMWSSGYRNQFGPNYPYHLDETYPQDEWLERNLVLGQPFSSWSDYRMVLQRRIYMIDHENQWRVANEDRKEYMRKALDLPSDVDTWEEYEDAYLKFYIVASNAELRAEELDPNIVGGTTKTDGTFIPFKENTVYVHVNPENGLSTFTGVRLNQTEEDNVSIYGIVPEGITVIYTNENGNPLPAGTPTPRLYEKHMAELEKAQTLLQQQIEEHKMLLDLDMLLNPPEAKKQGGAVPHEHVHEQDPSHTHERPKDSEVVPLPQRPHPDAKRLPPGLEIPPELRTPDAVQQWWTQLEALHGGQLPKDLQALRAVITELEKIKQEGEARLKPPSRPERPAPSPNAPPEGGSPD